MLHPRFVTMLFGFALAASGQVPTSDWADVQKIAPGTELRIDVENLKPIRGKLESVTDIALLLRPGVRPSVDRPQIVTIAVKKKSHRLRNTFIGLGIGVGVGLGIGAIAAAGCCDLNVQAGGALGLFWGTATGALWPTGGWRTVYRR